MIKVQMATKSAGWWVDSGASVHICNDMAQFKSYEEPIDIEVLRGKPFCGQSS